MKMLAALCFGGLSLTATAQGPVGWWTFDESGGNTAGASAGSVNGTLMGNAAFALGGVSNNSVSVPAVSENDYVDFGDNFGFASGPFTASAWVNTTDTSSNSTIILGKHHATIVAGWMLRLNQDVAGYGLPGKASFYVSQGSNGGVPISGITVTDGLWHHVVGVYDGNSAALYVDGVYQDSRAAGVNNATDADFTVGSAYRGGGSLHQRV